MYMYLAQRSSQSPGGLENRWRSISQLISEFTQKKSTLNSLLSRRNVQLGGRILSLRLIIVPGGARTGNGTEKTWRRGLKPSALLWWSGHPRFIFGKKKRITLSVEHVWFTPYSVGRKFRFLFHTIV